MADVSGLLRKDGGLPAKIRWHLNRWMLRHLGLLRRCGMTMTVHDVFGAPGDTLLTATVCRNIAERFPGLRINCITPNPELLGDDPHIHSLNSAETYVCLRQWYLDLIDKKDGSTHVLAGSMRSLGFATYDVRAKVYLTKEEIDAGRTRVSDLARPIVSVNARSKEPVKTWPVERWQRLVALLREDFDVVQLGDGAEPTLEGVRSFAGRLSLRESMAVLSHARVHIGPDSFLMHAANGLDVPTVALFGGSRTAENAGYAANINIYVPMPCGPCYIHEARGERCAHDIECMKRIAVEEVHAAVLKLVK